MRGTEIGDRGLAFGLCREGLYGVLDPKAVLLWGFVCLWLAIMGDLAWRTSEKS